MHVYAQLRRKGRLPSTHGRADAPAREEPDFAPEDAADIDRCLSALSAEHREVLLLRFLEDMPYDQIARTIGCEVGTVRSRLHYARTPCGEKSRTPRGESKIGDGASARGPLNCAKDVSSASMLKDPAPPLAAAARASSPAWPSHSALMAGAVAAWAAGFTVFFLPRLQYDAGRLAFAQEVRMAAASEPTSACFLPARRSSTATPNPRR